MPLALPEAAAAVVLPMPKRAARSRSHLAEPAHPEVQPSDPWLAVPGGRVLVEAWRGDLPLDDPQVSPLAGDLRGLRPVTVLTGTRDVLNPNAHVLVGKLRDAGVAVDLHEAAGSFHVYALLPTRNGYAGRVAMISALRAALTSTGWAFSARHPPAKE